MNVETGTMCWFDFATKDQTKAMAFFKTVFGWQYEAMGKEYWMIKVDKETIGGLRLETKSEFKAAQGFTPYFAVPSIKEAKGLVSKAGGKLVGETVAIEGEHGFYQWFSDLDGNVLSLWSKKP